MDGGRAHGLGLDFNHPHLCNDGVLLHLGRPQVGILREADEERSDSKGTLPSERRPPEVSSPFLSGAFSAPLKNLSAGRDAGAPSEWSWGECRE